MSNKSSEETSCTQTQKSSESRPPISAISYVICFLIFVLVFGLIISLPIVLTISHEPPPTKFSLVEASIAQFNLTNNNTLYYNFEVSITAKNFYNDIESYDKPVTAIASYKGNQLDSVKIAPF
jgi:ABC-type transport system involved in multi-copper enzyme maturation permease subunit